jgi:hypothetical protein
MQFPADADSSLPAKSVLALAPDGFPSGSDTAEGAACDFARAFIQHDSRLLLLTCLPPYGDPTTAKSYRGQLDQIIAQMKEDASALHPSPHGPKAIGKCFAARHLQMDGPASYAYAVLGYQDVMFVDVGAFSFDGTRHLIRTLVIETKPGKWLVDPFPDLSPLLSAGLNKESPSKDDFSSGH